jgi:hypothetical protein
MKMLFGKYQDYEISEIPKSYLQWLANTVDLYGPLREAVFDELFGAAGEKLNLNRSEKGR